LVSLWPSVTPDALTIDGWRLKVASDAMVRFRVALLEAVAGQMSRLQLRHLPGAVWVDFLSATQEGEVTSAVHP
jgi:hypothetical protein